MKRYSTAPIHGVDIHYQLAGAGEPLVLIHAGIADLSMWDDQWEPFTQRYMVLRYDVRGWGQTPCPPGQYSDHADLLRLLDHLNIDRTHLLGCSNGGKIALEFALAYPERARSLVLSGPGLAGFEWHDDATQALVERIGQSYEAGDLEKAAELDCRLWVDGLYRTPDQVDPGVRARVLQSIRYLFGLPEDEGERIPLDPPALDRLPELEHPTLLLMGELDTPDIQAIGAYLEEKVPDIQRVDIPATAHLPNMEKPAEFNRLVLDFLAGLFGSG